MVVLRAQCLDFRRSPSPSSVAAEGRARGVRDAHGCHKINIMHFSTDSHKHRQYVSTVEA